MVDKVDAVIYAANLRTAILAILLAPKNLGVFLGIDGGLPPDFSNPNPISEQRKSHFPHPFSDLVFAG